MYASVKLAERIAREAFAGKVDLAGQPYICHLERVVSRVAATTGNVSFLPAAWLHDLLEDCPEWTEAALRGVLDKDTVDTVVLLCKKANQDYFQYIASLKNNIAALEIKKADLFDNMNLARLPAITEEDISRLYKYQQAYKMVEGFIAEIHSDK